MRKILNYLLEHKTLNRSDAENVLTNIAKGNYSDSEIASFITVYLMRSITVEELCGFRDALLNFRLKVDLHDFDTIDVCGTGGDGKDTFNISTLSAFVIAGAGGKVAKHGNYAATSVCGSSNVMEFLGYHFSTDQDKLHREIDKTGVCFMHAPLFNPAMKNVAPVRKALKVKTFFNMLGPMINPSIPTRQFVGVYSLEIARLYNYMYQELGIPYAIVHSLDGYDEISLTSDFKYIDNGVESIVKPENIGYKRVGQKKLNGGTTIKEAADIFINVLKGKATEAQRAVVIANSQHALKCYYPAKTLDECKSLADESLSDGKAYESLKKLIEMQ